MSGGCCRVGRKTIWCPQISQGQCPKGPKVSGGFTDVLEIRGTLPLNPAEASPKWYAPGVGMIGDDELRITKVEQPK